MKTTRHLCLAITCLAAASALVLPAHATQPPGILNYQGMIAVDGAPFDGSGSFRFALVDAAGTTTHWSNDGTSTTGDEPTAAVSLTVNSGRYSVALGDTSLANMTAAIPTSVFADNADVRLRVWFDDGVNGSQLLSPDQRLAAVGYALAAGSVSAGSVGSDQLAAGAVTTTALADGAVTSPKIAAGTVIPAQTIVGTSQAATANTSYTATSDSLTTIDLNDTVADVGDTVQISGAGTGGWVASLYQPDQWTARESIRIWEDVASSADGSKLVAVVNYGQIYTSANSGVDWTPQATDHHWRSVASSADGTKLVAISVNQIYTSTDSGVSWTPRENNRQLWKVASSADGTKLVAAVYNGQVYTSANSGADWTPRVTTGADRQWQCVASSADGSKLVAVASSAQIYTSTDSGESWTARESARDWRSVASSADGSKLVAAVHGGQIYTSTDSGVNWTARESSRLWFSVASSADGSKLVAVVFNGQIYTSTDSGESWTARESSREWRSVASSADGSKLVAVAWYSQIYSSGLVASGAQGTSTTLQYLGDGEWVPVRDLPSGGLAEILGGGANAGGADMTNLGAVSATFFSGDGSGLTGINVDDADADPTNELQDLAAVLGEGSNAGGAGMSNLGVVGVGSIATGSESNAQAASSNHSGDDFLVAPWIYSNAIEAQGERGAQSTLITVGADGTFGGADQIHLVTSGQSRVEVTSTGRVGIGRTPAANTLEVEGDASKSIVGSWFANSDRRIKEDIHEVDHALETLDKVRLVSFEYTDDYRASHPGVNEGRYLNVVAQEFAEVFPDHVKPSGELLDGEPILQVDTYPLTIYAAAAVQELNRKAERRMEQLEAENAELKRQNAALDHRLDALEALLSRSTNKDNVRGQ